jgi:hypothetical protein
MSIPNVNQNLAFRRFVPAQKPNFESRWVYKRRLKESFIYVKKTAPQETKVKK